MDAAGRDAPMSPQERSSHTAFIDNNTLYVWGGYRVVDGADVMLPSDEIWLCDLNSGMWERREIAGSDVPRDLSGFCGAHVNSTLYIFAGCDTVGYTNDMFSVDLTEPHYSWNKVTDAKGKTPSPRQKHSCWVHRDRLIYFGGYGCKTLGQVRNSSSSSFVMDEMSLTTIGDTTFRFWGWNNEVNVFDTRTATWTVPETQGSAPTPRDCHSTALLGNKGYVSGGVETPEMDMFCLDLESWTWTKFDIPLFSSPMGRSMHAMAAISDHAVLVYGGLGTDGNTLNDAWLFNTLKREWTNMNHAHKGKPRVCHTANLGNDGDVVVFGGSSNLCIVADTMVVLRAPSQHHCSNMIVFQMQPYSLSRLCEDFVGKNPQLFVRQLNWLPPKLRTKVDKRVAFFSNLTPCLAD
ncbi:kelch domain-containing protein 1-like [Solea solea]|uniref:kelch domain-containing protein 1-like n=1 Tax=Solea solea TaxID=90069 RepID=UPI00272D9633|nr:kelch domain-containing protein 1-like [Solea solea]